MLKNTVQKSNRPKPFAFLWMLMLCAVFFLACSDGEPAISDTVETPTTVMIYMQDTDFDSDGSIALADIAEIESCGIDVTKNNLLLCTDTAFPGKTAEDAEDAEGAEDVPVYSLQKLTETGWEEVAAPADFDGSLSGFLHYGYTNFSADEYALILWDLSSASVFTRVMEEMYTADATYLADIQNELSLSPFKGDTKLSFIGFDTSFMATAEVASVCADHANYLIASEDAELPCGWDYSALFYTGKTDTKTLGTKITEAYYQSAEAYLTEREFHYRTVSLSCVDLSYIDALCDSVNALFAKAKQDVANDYTTVALLRAAAHSVSRDYQLDYDLADLYSLSAQFSALYPSESAALCDVLSGMTVSNRTNEENLGGLSLYFPFDNHYLIRNNFADTCKKLGLYSEYYAFLDIYIAEWNDSAYLDAYPSIGKVSVGDDLHFSLTLDEEIAKTCTSAVYYILAPLIEGTEPELIGYGMLYADAVQNDGGTLQASFNGNMLFLQNTFGEFSQVAPTGIYANGDVTKYLFNSALDDLDEEKEHSFDPYIDRDSVFVIAKDNQTNALFFSDICAGCHGPNPLSKTLSTKQGITSLEQYEQVDWIGGGLYRAPSAYKNGLLEDFFAWPKATLGASDTTYFVPCASVKTGEFADLSYAKTAKSDLFVVFELTDAHGNRFCSEPAAFSLTPAVYSPYTPEPIEVSFTEGDSVTVFENEFISLSVSRRAYLGSMTYYITAENKSDKKLKITADNLLFNGNITDGQAIPLLKVSDSDEELSFSLFSFYNLEPHGKAEADIDLEQIAKYGLLDDLFSLSFTFALEDFAEDVTLIKNQKVNINLSEKTTVNLWETLHQKQDFYAPFMGAMASEQVLFENDSVRITLLGCGKEISNDAFQSLDFSLKYENKTNDEISFTLVGASLNGIFCKKAGRSYLPGGLVCYDSFEIYYSDLEYLDIHTVDTMRLGFFVHGKAGAWLEWCDVDMAEYAKSSSGFTEGDEVLFDQDGIRITYKRVYRNSSGLFWEFAVVNNSDKDIELDIYDKKINGAVTTFSYPYLSNGNVGAHQKTYATVEYLDRDTALQVKNLSFCFYIYRMDGNTFYNKTDEYTVYTK